MRTPRLVALAVALGLTVASAAGACPSCPTGERARAEVLDDGFGANLTYAVVPFAVIGLVSRWAERRTRGDA